MGDDTSQTGPGVDTSLEMQSLTLLLALGLASSDKLDRTYLPPPGSKFAGGSPGDIQVPLQFPKETYSTTLRPLAPGQTKDRTSEDSRLTVGIDRSNGLPNIQTGSIATPRPQVPITFFQDPHKLPSTTTSYAFTQTTTFPSDGFETTVSPVGPFNDFHQQTTGLPNYPQLSQGQQINNHPGLDQHVTLGPHLGFTPTLGPTIQGPGFVSQFPTSGQTFVDGHPGFNQVHPQDISQYQQSLHPSSTISPTPEKNIQPGFVPQFPDPNQRLTNYLGVQPPRQLIGQQSSFPVQPSQGIPQNYQPGISQYGDISHNIQGTVAQGSNIPEQQGSQQPIHFGGPQGNIPSTTTLQGLPATYQPGTPQYRTDLVHNQDNNNITPGLNIPQQFRGQRPTLDGQQGSLPSTVYPQGISSGFQPGNSQIGNIQGAIVPDQQPPQHFDEHGTFSSTISPQGFPSSYQPSSQYDNLVRTPAPNISQSGSLPGQQIQTGRPGSRPSSNQALTQFNDDKRPQQYPTPQPGGLGVSDGNSQMIFRPDSTATSSILPPGYSNQPTFPSTTPTIFPSYGTTPSDRTHSSTTSAYPKLSNQENIVSRPERPQAEFDRNAVILNYENVLTPEGYAYSFDTSNGIHADESASVIDGVKALGSYSYTGDDGKLYSVIYSADENGFQPSGDHLPTPPPIPEAIQRVIEQAAKDKEAGISHDGFYDENKYGHDKYQGSKNRYHPKTQDRIIVNGADIPDDDKNEFLDAGIIKSGSQDGTRRPDTTTIQSPDKNDRDFSKNQQNLRGSQIGDSKRIRPSSRNPSSRRPPIEAPKQDEYQDVIDEYQDFINENEKAQYVPSQHPIGSTRKDSIRYRPMTAGGKPVRPGSSHTKHVESQDEDNEDIPDELDNFRKEPHLGKNNRLPQKAHNRLPTKITETKNVEYDSNSQVPLGETDFREEPVTRRPQGSKRPSFQTDDRQSQRYDKGEHPLQPHLLPDSTISTSYAESEDYSDGERQKPGVSSIVKETTSYRPQRPETSSTSSDTYSARPQLPGASVSQTHDGQQDNNYNKKDRRPTSDQYTGVVSKKYETQKMADEESGYQYSVPLNKFVQGDTNKFPPRFTEVKEATSTNRPYEISDKQTTIQPFMTPNVSRDDYSYESNDDNINQKFPSRNPSKSSSGKAKLMPVATDDDYEYDLELDNASEYKENGVKPNQNIGDESNAPTEVPTGMPGTSRISSTRRPTYEQSKQTTTRPQYDVQNSQDNQDRRGQTQPVRPGQTRDKQYPVESTERSEGKPGQVNYYRQSTKISKTPDYNFVSATNPISTKTQTRPGSSNSQTTQSQYPTTYDAMDGSGATIDDSEETLISAFVTTRPDIGSRIPVNGAASRPGYYDRTAMPGFSTSRPGISQAPTHKHISRPLVSEYSESTTVQGPATIRSGFPRIPSGRPTSEPVTDYDSTIAPGSPTVRPGTSRFPSTTFRPSIKADYAGTTSPNYTTAKPGSMFSGRPGIQYQNVPSTTYRPNYTFADISSKPAGQSRPGMTVDRYGRPITEPGREMTGSTTYRPDYPITSTQYLGSPTDGPYQDFRTPSKVPQAFKPNETRFRKPEYRHPQGSDIEQEPNTDSVQYQGVPTSHLGQSSTERTFGEDFSGPKQPQRFDPETGYHY